MLRRRRRTGRVSQCTCILIDILACLPRDSAAERDCTREDLVAVPTDNGREAPLPRVSSLDQQPNPSSILFLHASFSSIDKSSDGQIA